MILRLLRWWSLKPFYDKGVDHFCGTTRDERHFEFLQCYWSHRLAGCSHKGSLMLARMELRMLVSRCRARHERRQVLEEIKQVLDDISEMSRIDRVIDEIETKRS